MAGLWGPGEKLAPRVPTAQWWHCRTKLGHQDLVCTSSVTEGELTHDTWPPCMEGFPTTHSPQLRSQGAPWAGRGEGVVEGNQALKEEGRRPPPLGLTRG